MISEARLVQLKFQAANRGVTPSSLERMTRDGVQTRPDVSIMIPITVPELQDLLAAYEEKSSGK
jgi:hypothetical protein